MRHLCVAALGGLLAVSTAQAVVVGPADSTAPWLGFMNVFDLPSNGGGFIFASGWGVADLVTTFNDPAHTMTISPNTIGDPNPFWYTPAGGPGATGNKIMEANTYIETTGVYSGVPLTFEGTVLSDTLTSAHVARVFIRDFAPDYSSVNEVIVPLGAGPFSLTLNTIADPARHVQWGFQLKGPDVWFTDTAPFGSLVIATVPAPASIGMLGLGGLLVARRRR